MPAHQASRLHQFRVADRGLGNHQPGPEFQPAGQLVRLVFNDGVDPDPGPTQVEHVSEEEVDQLFYALELKEQQLAQAKQQNEGLQQEVLTARQMSARGGNAEPKFIEIHHQYTF